MKKQKFKEGDIVRIKSGIYFDIGDKVVIIEPVKDDQPLMRRSSDGKEWFVYLKNVELIKKSPKKTVKKGLYDFWNIERVDNGYVAKNAVIHAVFSTKAKMWKWLDQNTK